MRRYSGCLCAVLLVVAGCDVEVGDADFDSSFFEDSGRDSATSEDDAGAAPKDAGEVPDAGERADAGEKQDSGPSETMDAGPMSEPEHPEDLAKHLAAGSCAALESCISAPLLRESLQGQDCVSYRTRLYQDRDLHWLPKAVSKGAVTFKPELLAKCEADLKALGCEVATKRLPQSCLDAAHGGVAVDGACAVDQQCAGKAFCDKGGTETCPGTCASLQTAGLPCRATAQCVDGLICRGGVCDSPAIEGDECSVSYTAAGGAGYRECPPGLLCQGPTTDNLHCQSVKTVLTAKLGQPCSATGTLCEFGLVCQSQSATSAMGTCAAPVAKGEKCRRAVPGQCPSGQYCKDAAANATGRAAPGVDGVCADLPGAGKSCDDVIGCQPGAVCSDDKMCHALQSVGGECTESRQCYGGSCLADICTTPLDCTM